MYKLIEISYLIFCLCLDFLINFDSCNFISLGFGYGKVVVKLGGSGFVEVVFMD